MQKYRLLIFAFLCLIFDFMLSCHFDF